MREKGKNFIFYDKLDSIMLKGTTYKYIGSACYIAAFDLNASIMTSIMAPIASKLQVPTTNVSLLACRIFHSQATTGYYFHYWYMIITRVIARVQFIKGNVMSS